jgi:propanol-preferring alcohol dehydrogenase
MRALQLIGHRQIRVQDVADPEIASDEVLVRVGGAGLCHSDLHVFDFEGFPLVPLTLGHETSGTVEQVGAGVEGVAVGDGVLVCLVWACGVCRPCIQGRDNACVAAGRLGVPPAPGLSLDGGMAEYLKVKARYLEPLDGLDPVTSAPLADAALTPYHAIDGARYRLDPGSTAVVIGVGGLGHMGVQILKATTAARIVAVDTAEDKLDIARCHGADETLLADAQAADAILQMTDGYGADAVFDFVGVQPSVTLATQVIAPDGALRFVGLGGGTFEYGTGAMAASLPWGVDIRKSYGGTRRDQRAVLDLARAGRLTIETEQYALEDGPKAFEDLEHGRVRGRAILVPSS